MLRDTLVGLIEPMRAARELNPLALFTEQKKPSDDRPPCLENPRPEGTESTLTENAASPFHAEPKQMNKQHESQQKITNSKPIPHIPLPFKEVIADVLKVKPPEKERQKNQKDAKTS
jgi:hypothetical protein